jgi:hypothetical protein
MNGRRFEEDDVDRACNTWAYQWVRAFARPPEPGQTIGQLNCTLGRVRELHDGASSTTESCQQWPEVFLGEGLLVAIALKAMSERSRDVIFQHYVVRWFEYREEKGWVRRSRPRKQVQVAHAMKCGLSRYYVLRDTAKSCVSVVLSLDTKVLARAGSRSAPSAQVAKVPLAIATP